MVSLSFEEAAKFLQGDPYGRLKPFIDLDPAWAVGTATVQGRAKKFLHV